MNICSLLKFQERPLVWKVKGGLVRVNFRWPAQKEKERLSFSKGGPLQRRLRETGPRSNTMSRILSVL